MVVGAYPSARFESRASCDGSGRKRLVPVADNLHPFAKEEYFDGTRVRRLESGEGIRTYLLSQLGIEPNGCWITDLVKVFLHKPAHVDSCRAVVPNFRVPELRTRFLELGRRSLPWIKQECAICRPKLVITLGEEVAQVVSGEPKATANDLPNRPAARALGIGGFPTVYVPHPDACRRSEKWRTNMAARVRLAKTLVG
jgi:uracil-DNA glycosylase